MPVNMPDHRNPLSVRVFPGILLIQAVDIRQDHQQVRLHDIRHNSGKGVVIPEILAVQLVDGYGVVLGYKLYRGDRAYQRLY